MKHPAPALFGILAATILLGSMPAAIAQLPSSPPETKEQHDARMAWFRDARFGMFIHWGLYAVPAGIHKGRKEGGGGTEWIMHELRIPIAEYAEYAKQFDPEQFNADAWVALAKRAGVKYIVFTAKHHEGFAMFRTAASPFNIIDATPFKRDPVKELAEACHKQGIIFGLYYSQNWDWHHPGGGDGDWDPAHKGDADAYINQIVIPQLREILTHYGEISVIWWDLPGGVINKARADLIYKTVKSINPNIVMNNRLGGGCPGDTETPEETIPARGLPGRDWETCMTMNNTWGYSSTDMNYKSAETLLRNLIDIASKGGNYLLNVGPDANGIIPAPQVERLEAMGRWLKVNGEAIYGTHAAPLARAPAWGRLTVKGDRLYLHVFSWPKDGRLTLPILNSVKEAHLLAAPGEPVGISRAPDGLTITLPANAPDPVASVISLQVDGPITEAPPAQLGPQADGSYLLGADAAQVMSAGNDDPQANQEADPKGTHIGVWMRSTDYVQWTLRVQRPGDYAVSLAYAAVPAAAGNVATLNVGDQAIKATIQSTGDWMTTFKSFDTGTVHIAQPGTIVVSLKPDKIQGGQVFVICVPSG